VRSTILSVTLSSKTIRQQLMMDIGNPANAAMPISRCTLSTTRAPCVTRTLCDDAEERERRDDRSAVCLRKLPLMLLRLLPCRADTRLLVLPAELEHICSHQAGVAETISQREHGGDHPEAQYHCVRRMVYVIGDLNLAGLEASICECICDEVRDAQAHRPH
jgi:hypothetical protein